MPKVYLDVCCLNRPFDDQQQDRVYLEAEAILLILKPCESGEWQWFSRAVGNYEVDKIPNQERRNRIRELLWGATETLRLTNAWIEQLLLLF
jgi:hypothetical protein